MTTYKVFRQRGAIRADGEGPNDYTLIGEYDGSNAQGAIRAAVLALPEDARAKASTETFAATPSSNWQLYAPKVDTKTTVSFA